MTDPLRVALVGFGYWGRNLARNLRAATTTELVGIADSDAANLDIARQSNDELRTWTSLDEALADDDVEAVVLATPAAMHADMAIRALDAGRHVMVEKPLALDPESAAQVVEVADGHGLLAMVGHTFLYSTPVRRLREYIADGELGNIQYLSSQRLSLGRIRRDCSALWNFAPHDVSIMRYLLDEPIVEVTAKGFSFIEPGIDDVVFASLTFASGAGANLHVSWVDPRKSRLVTVVGDRKMAIYNDVSADQKIWLVDAGVARSQNPSLGEYESMGEFQWRTRAGDILIPKLDLVEPLLVEMETFGRCARTGEPCPTSAAHGAEVVRVLAAIDKSAQSGGSPIAVVA
jgi:predicted dehydrogenase